MAKIDLKKHLGKTAYFECKGLLIEVKVIQAKFSFGNYRYLIQPVSGTGQVWTEKVKFKQEKKP